MFETVNLLPKTQLRVKQTNRIVLGLQLVSRILAGVFLMILVAEYAWAAITNQRIQTTRARITAVQDEVEQQADIEGRYLYYQQVLANATTIIENRKNFLESLGQLYALLDPSVTIEGVSFSEQTLVFSGRAPNVQVFVQTLDSFRGAAEAESSLFGDMVLQTSNREPDGKYSFKIEIELLSGQSGA